MQFFFLITTSCQLGRWKIESKRVGNWFHGTENSYQDGSVTVVWSLCLCTTDKVFNGKNYSVMQVIYRCTSLFRAWAVLQFVKN